MMDWHNTLRTIYSILRDNGHATVADEIHEGQLSGGTGGEVFDIVISKLILVKQNQPHIYQLIRHEVESLIEYGISLGYLSKGIIS